jgi:hypothetical protein
MFFFTTTYILFRVTIRAAFYNRKIQTLQLPTQLPGCKKRTRATPVAVSFFAFFSRHIDETKETAKRLL